MITNSFYLKIKKQYLIQLAEIMVKCGADMSVEEQIDMLEKYPMDMEEILDLIDMYKKINSKKILKYKNQMLE